MARFVSQYKNHTVGIRNHSESHLGRDGKMVPEVPGLEAVFEHRLTTASDVEEAKSRLTFKGLMQVEGTEEPYGYGLRVSVFDSEQAQLANGWSDADRILVEEVLRSAHGNGSDFFESIPAPAVKPWKGYDSVTDVDRILELALAIDADLAEVVSYERENKNREDVIAALLAAQAEQDETVIIRA